MAFTPKLRSAALPRFEQLLHLELKADRESELLVVGI